MYTPHSESETVQEKSGNWSVTFRSIFSPQISFEFVSHNSLPTCFDILNRQATPPIGLVDTLLRSRETSVYISRRREELAEFYIEILGSTSPNAFRREVLFKINGSLEQLDAASTLVKGQVIKSTSSAVLVSALGLLLFGFGVITGELALMLLGVGVACGAWLADYYRRLTQIDYIKDILERKTFY